MTGLEPTEQYDGRVTVHVLRDDGTDERVRCSSYREAIAEVKRRQAGDGVVKIEDRDGDVVFTSAAMDIEAWEVEWEHEKRRLAVDVEPRDCPYDDRACFSDDLCVRCQIDKVQGRG